VNLFPPLAAAPSSPFLTPALIVNPERSIRTIWDVSICVVGSADDLPLEISALHRQHCPEVISSNTEESLCRVRPSCLGSESSLLFISP
jgi:hypothetical protein